MGRGCIGVSMGGTIIHTRRHKSRKARRRAVQQHRQRSCVNCVHYAGDNLNAYCQACKQDHFLAYENKWGYQ